MCLRQLCHSTAGSRRLECASVERGFAVLGFRVQRSGFRLVVVGVSAHLGPPPPVATFLEVTVGEGVGEIIRGLKALTG
jgi:hypothetical protein